MQAKEKSSSNWPVLDGINWSLLTGSRVTQLWVFGTCSATWAYSMCALYSDINYSTIARCHFLISTVLYALNFLCHFNVLSTSNSVLITAHICLCRIELYFCKWLYNFTICEKTETNIFTLPESVHYIQQANYCGKNIWHNVFSLHFFFNVATKHLLSA